MHFYGDAMSKNGLITREMMEKECRVVNSVRFPFTNPILLWIEERRNSQAWEAFSKDPNLSNEDRKEAVFQAQWFKEHEKLLHARMSRKGPIAKDWKALYRADHLPGEPRVFRACIFDLRNPHFDVLYLSRKLYKTRKGARNRAKIVLNRYESTGGITR